MKHALHAIVMAAALTWVPAFADAAVIEYQATDLGGSIWQYDYFIASGSFAAQQGFVVFFDESLYANLAPVPPAPAEWDVLVTQPDVVLQSDGTYDALALVNGPAFTGPFSVTFTWFGAGAPGSQPFQKYTLDASGFPVPDLGESGVTTPRAAVPEPSALLLLAVGGACAHSRRRKRAPIPFSSR